MTAELRGLYLVTPSWSDGARLLAACEAALAGGPALLQYRNKTAPAATRLAEASALLDLCRRAGVRMLVNDDLALALAIGADGVHLGRDDGDLPAARAALGPGGLLGASCYGDLERAGRAAAAGADYLAFGAMFASPTKPAAPLAPRGLLTRARAELGRPVAAIGGITLDTAPALIAAGASLLAVITDVFEHSDPAGIVRAYQALFSDAAPARLDPSRKSP